MMRTLTHGRAALAIATVAAALAALPAAAAASAPTPLALDSPGNGSPPQIAYDPSSGTTYVGWSDRGAAGGVDLCVLPAGATACEGGVQLLSDNVNPTTYPSIGLGAIVVLPGGETVVIGVPGTTATVAWASPKGGAAFLSSAGDMNGLQNGGNPISQISLYRAGNDAVALGPSDVGLLDSFHDYFGDAPINATEPMIPMPNSNVGGLYQTKALFTNGPEVAAAPAPAPAAPGSVVVVGVGSNQGNPVPAGCPSYFGTGFGATVGTVTGASNAAGTLNAAGMPQYGLITCLADAPVLAGGANGIGLLEREGSAVTGNGTSAAIDYRAFHATATGGSFGAPIQVADLTNAGGGGTADDYLSEDSSTGVYATWIDHLGLNFDYSANGGATWGAAPAIVPGSPSGGFTDSVLAGVAGGTAEIAYDNNLGSGTQVFVEAVNYQALTTTTPPPAPASIGASARSNGKTVTITVGCATTPCTITVAMTAHSGHKTVKMGGGKFTLHKQGQNKLAVKLTPAGKKLLKSHHGHATVTVAVSVAGNATGKPVTRTIKLR
jgi:hypothetical protein